MSFFDLTKHKAVFFDANGVFIGIKKFKRTEKTFMFKEGRYNVDLTNTCIKLKNPLWRVHYYLYTLDNPDSISLKHGVSPVYNAEVYNAIHETKVIKDINDLGRKNWLVELLTPRNILILIIVIASIWYFSSGGTTEGLTKGLTGNG